MTRYQVLRRIGCDPLTASGVAFMNWLWGQPQGVISFMTVVIEYDPKEGA
jgi:hypothetical protein